MEYIRSFIAIELPPDIKAQLRELEDSLKVRGVNCVKWVEPENIHLTLKFLGNVVVEQLDEIARVLTEAVYGIPPFRLEVTELGVFPNLKRVQVVWVGLSGELDKLHQLQQNIESGMAKLGFPAEARPFVPHLTLGRARDYTSPVDREKCGQLIASAQSKVSGAILAETVNLMKSELTRSGPIYTKVGQFKLENLL